MRIFIITVGALFSLISAVAQPAQGGASRATQTKQALTAAASAFKAGNDDQGEAALAGTARSPAGSSSWHTELGSQLARLADVQKAAGAPKDAIRAAQRAVAHLTTAANATGGTDQLGAALALQQAGYISENFLGDRAAARKFYQQALAFVPTLKAAQDSLAWLDAGDAQLNLKAKH